MFFEPLYAKFPKIAERQTRTATVMNMYPELDGKDFSFVPAYCGDKKCDCRRAMNYVYSSDPTLKGRRLALLSYGWEPKSFYQKWMRGFSDKEIDWFKGPDIDPFQTQSEYAEPLLGIFKNMLKDPEYAKRFITQYALMKWKLGMKLPKDLKPYLKMMEPCPCGSEKILKICCAAG
jgi:hypothetical protein